MELWWNFKMSRNWVLERLPYLAPSSGEASINSGLNWKPDGRALVRIALLLLIWLYKIRSQAALSLDSDNALTLLVDVLWQFCREEKSHANTSQYEPHNNHTRVHSMLQPHLHVMLFQGVMCHQPLQWVADSDSANYFLLGMAVTFWCHIDTIFIRCIQRQERRRTARWYKNHQELTDSTELPTCILVPLCQLNMQGGKYGQSSHTIPKFP